MPARKETLQDRSNTSPLILVEPQGPRHYLAAAMFRLTAAIKLCIKSPHQPEGATSDRQSLLLAGYRFPSRVARVRELPHRGGWRGDTGVCQAGTFLWPAPGFPERARAAGDHFRNRSIRHLFPYYQLVIKSVQSPEAGPYRIIMTMVLGQPQLVHVAAGRIILPHGRDTGYFAGAP
jgi:hypothetical protein